MYLFHHYLHNKNISDDIDLYDIAISSLILSCKYNDIHISRNQILECYWQSLHKNLKKYEYKYLYYCQY